MSDAKYKVNFNKRPTDTGKKNRKMSDAKYKVKVNKRPTDTGIKTEKCLTQNIKLISIKLTTEKWK